MKYDWKKLTDYLLNECSLETKREIDELIANNLEFKKTIDEMKKVITFEQESLNITDTETKWEEIEAQLAKASQKVKVVNKQYSDSRSSSFKLLRYAAVITLIIVGALSYFTMSKRAPTTLQSEYKTLSVQNGERRTIVLFDGTTVNLDCGSELRYPTKFGTTREVFLKGEGYFQVAKDSTRPFIVHADGTTIQVLGTKFNIRTWDDKSNDVIVTVVEGKVAFCLDNKSLKNSVLLTKNMQSNLSFNGVISEPKVVNADNYSRWMYNEVHFRNASMKEIIAQLERWYNLEFDIPEGILQKTDLAVHLNNSSINSILEMLATLTDTKVIRKGNKISFRTYGKMGVNND
jgi:ferric-dicitrate binding protein FerR (iron transport regulator)